MHSTSLLENKHISYISIYFEDFLKLFFSNKTNVGIMSRHQITTRHYAPRNGFYLMFLWQV
jgi:hypothetical protein